jgi:hypothetical protein
LRFDLIERRELWRQIKTNQAEREAFVKRMGSGHWIHSFSTACQTRIWPLSFWRNGRCDFLLAAGAKAQEMRGFLTTPLRNTPL